MRDARVNTGRTGRPQQGGNGRGAAPNGYARRAPQPVSPAREYAAQPGQREYAPRVRRKGIGRRGLIGIGTVALLAVIAVAVVIGMLKNADHQSYYADTITPGVTIDGKDVSGRNVDELKNELHTQYQSVIDRIAVRITHESQSWQLAGKDLGASHNVDEIVNAAALLARTGDIAQRRAEAKAIKEQGRAFKVDLRLDQGMLKTKLGEIAGGVSKAGQDATVVFNPSLVDFEIPKNIEDLDPPQSQIDQMFHVNPEVAGQTVDVEAMTQKILEDLAGDNNAEVELIVTQFVPQMTEAKLRESFHLLSAYRTKLSSSNTEDRIHNVNLSLSQFNGITLYPGQELSFNETTGPRTEANGYRLAPTIGSDKALVDDFGGGVCQSSTTLYNAALMSGCEVLERNHHSIPSSYALKGFDAMVNYPSSDLKFKNASEMPLYIKAYVKVPYVYVMVFGAPLQGGMRIERLSEVVYEGPTPEVEVRVDEKGEYLDKVKYQDDEPHVAINSHPERKIRATLVYKDANGNEVNRKVLYEDHFKEIKGVAYVGKELRPTSTPKPEETPTPDGGDDD